MFIMQDLIENHRHAARVRHGFLCILAFDLMAAGAESFCDRSLYVGIEFCHPCLIEQG